MQVKIRKINIIKWYLEYIAKRCNNILKFDNTVIIDYSKSNKLIS